MKSQLEKYDEALLTWLEEKFAPILPDEDLQILFAIPGRSYAEVTSGHYKDKLVLRRPRIAVTRAQYNHDMERSNVCPIRRMGYRSSTDRLHLKKTPFPFPIIIPYQISFWTDFEHEVQAYYVEFMQQLYAGCFSLLVNINELFSNKYITHVVADDVVIDGDTEPGPGKKENMMTFSTDAQGWLFPESSTEQKVVREIVVNARDFDSLALIDTVRSAAPLKVGEGDALQTVFAFTLPAPIREPSVLVYTTIGAVESRAYDAAGGVITGDDVSGTINYTTGAISLTFTTAPDLGAGVYVEFQEE